MAPKTSASGLLLLILLLQDGAWHFEAQVNGLNRAILTPDRTISFISSLGTHSLNQVHSSNVPSILHGAVIDLEFELKFILQLLLAITLSSVHEHFQIAGVASMTT